MDMVSHIPLSFSYHSWHKFQIYRLVSLLLDGLPRMAENRELISVETNTENFYTPTWLSSLESHIGDIRVDKFLPLFPQLLVRLTTPIAKAHGEESRVVSQVRTTLHALLSRVRETFILLRLFNAIFCSFIIAGNRLLSQ